jgi:hypothetical protein
MTDDTAPIDAAPDTAADAGGAVELALRLIPPQAWETVFALVRIAVDPKFARRNLRSLHDSLAATTAAQKKLDADRVEFAVYERQTREELTARDIKLREKEVELATKKDAREDRLREREEHIRELEHRWAFVGEDDDVKTGFRQGEFSALYKARAAYGSAHDHSLDDISRAMAEKVPSRVVQHDPQGTMFPSHVSLTRDEPQAVRVRPGRSARAGA